MCKSGSCINGGKLVKEIITQVRGDEVIQIQINVIKEMAELWKGCIY